MSKTFDQARREILDHLHGAGWSLSSLTLRTPHATSPDRSLRFWFKPQAVHYTEGPRHELGEARTVGYDFDIRKHDGNSFLAFVRSRWGAHLSSAGRGRY